MSPGPRESTARDVMTGGTECVGENETVAGAAKKLAQLNVDALPVCGEDGTLRGMITEHEIVAGGIALGKDPNETTAGEFGYGKPVTIGADDSLLSTTKTMTAHDVRRLPVVDGEDLVGVLSITDVAGKIDTEETDGG